MGHYQKNQREEYILDLHQLEDKFEKEFLAFKSSVQKPNIKIIKKFIAEKYKISVILTKCDQVSEDVENKLKNDLQNEISGLSVISVCSEEKATRTGITKPFGKNDVERQAFKDFFDSLILRLPLRCRSVMEKTLDVWVRQSNRKAEDNAGFAGIQKVT